MKYLAKSTSALSPATTMAEQIVHVPFSSQDRSKLEMDRLEIEHKLTLLEIPAPLVTKVYVGIPFLKNTMFKSKITSATKEIVVKSSKLIFEGSKRHWMRRNQAMS
ncbi:hypothetical protein PsorP6_015353 [Peronosclerospora sorghi]|uniref:Uncharacterized protein n=1 Tax=Peronosclerospora sorghi TaxID=230839 RepID=A0ACC0WP20_9STRA|nr:hypothetical protein PsorP6_015353 [Peronosclerospora sorghi]